jgi:DNA-binding CsgD family transcriptional regulator
LLEKEEEKNIIKNLSYISKLSKNQKEIKEMLGKLMTSIQISYQEKKMIFNMNIFILAEF